MYTYTKQNFAAMKRFWANKEVTPMAGSIVPGKPMYDTENDCFYVCDSYVLLCCKGIPDEIRAAGEELGDKRRERFYKLLHKHDGNPTAVLAARPNGIDWSAWRPVRTKRTDRTNLYGLLFPPEIAPGDLSPKTELLSAVTSANVRDILLSSPQEIRLFTVPLPFNACNPLYFDNGVVSGILMPVRIGSISLPDVIDSTKRWHASAEISRPAPEPAPQEKKPAPQEIKPSAVPSPSPAPQKITREDIEHALCRGSGISEGKKRIVAQFAKHEGVDKNAAFLKKEYGVGGWSHAIPGKHGWLDHDGKGITLRAGADLTKPDDKKLITWKEAAAIIESLITSGRYTEGMEMPKQETAPAPVQEKKPAPKKPEAKKPTAAPAKKPAPAPQEEKTPAESLAAAAKTAAPKATVEIKGAKSSCPIVWVYKASSKEADALAVLGFVWSNKRQGYWMKPTATESRATA